MQGQLTDSSRIVSELDTASALGMTPKEAKKHLLKNQVGARVFVRVCDVICSFVILEFRTSLTPRSSHSSGSVRLYEICVWYPPISI